jgi:hypothetical protein
MMFSDELELDDDDAKLAAALELYVQAIEGEQKLRCPFTALGMHKLKRITKGYDLQAELNEGKAQCNGRVNGFATWQDFEGHISAKKANG